MKRTRKFLIAGAIAVGLSLLAPVSAYAGAGLPGFGDGICEPGMTWSQCARYRACVVFGICL